MAGDADGDADAALGPIDGAEAEGAAGHRRRAGTSRGGRARAKGCRARRRGAAKTAGTRPASGACPLHQSRARARTVSLLIAARPLTVAVSAAATTSTAEISASCRPGTAS